MNLLNWGHETGCLVLVFRCSLTKRRVSILPGHKGCVTLGLECLEGCFCCWLRMKAKANPRASRTERTSWMHGAFCRKRPASLHHMVDHLSNLAVYLELAVGWWVPAVFFFHVAPKKALCVCYLFLYKSKNLGSEFLNCGFGPWLRWWLTLVVDCLRNPRLERGCDIQNSNQHRPSWFIEREWQDAPIDWLYPLGWWKSMLFWLCVYVLDICKQGLKLKQLYNTRPLQFFFTAPVLWALTAGACLGKYQQAAVCLARLTHHSLAHGWILPGVLIGKTPRFAASVDILLYKHGKVFKEYVGAFFIAPILCNSADRSLPCHPGEVTSILVCNSIEFFECQATRCAEFTTFYANFANKMKVPLVPFLIPQACWEQVS